MASLVGVDVDVDVGGDGDGDDLTLAAQLGQHGDHPRQKLDCLPILHVLKRTQSPNYVKHRSTLHGRAARDCEMPCAVRLGSSAGPFGDVERNGKRRASKLVAQLTVAAGNRSAYLHGNGHKFDGAPVHIQLLKAEHA